RDAGRGIALDLGAEARHGRPAGLAQRDHDDGDQDDRQGWTPQIQSLPGRSCETLAPAAGFVMTRRLWQGWRVRTGAAYVAALRDGRAVYLDGERIKDVTSHPGFAEPIRHIAEIYETDRAVGYAVAPTQAEREQLAHRHPEPFRHPGVLRERDGAIVVRGVQAIATSATLADWRFLSSITPLVPGGEDYAISLVMPMNA